jgi:uncharacterized membrane protein YeaQ/YmgE (transglycosylase-associated protein family)
MNYVVMAVVGFVVGLLARALLPGDQKLGIILTTLLGMAGSLVANFLGQAMGLYPAGGAAGWVASVLGAMLVLWVYGRLNQRS